MIIVLFMFIYMFKGIFKNFLEENFNQGFIFKQKFDIKNKCQRGDKYFGFIFKDIVYII